MAANLAEAYGVRIESVITTGACWRAVLVRHLTANENNGQHNLFVDVVDQSGNRVFDPRLRIAWLDHPGDTTADYSNLDKPDTPIEKGDGNVPIEKAQTLTAWITGDGLPSDKVTGIHTRHADESIGGNSWGHHSFYIKFQRTTGGDKPTDPVDPPPTDPTLADHERRLQRIEALLNSWDGH